MNYKEFCEKLKERVLKNEDWGIREDDFKFYPDNFKGTTAEDISFVRETNMKYNTLESDVLRGDFITIHNDHESSGCVARFEVAYLFEEFENEGWVRVDYILNENIKRIKDTETFSILYNLENYELIKEHLMVRPLNYARNKAGLKEAVYKEYGDMAFVVYIVVQDSVPDFYTTKVQKSWLEKWEKTEEHVYEDAFARTHKFWEPKLFLHTIVDMCSESVNPYDTNTPVLNKYEIPTLTNHRTMNGAMTLFYPGMMKRIYELMGGEYFVAFTSVHEARIHHCDIFSANVIWDSLKGLNEEYNTDDDVLSEFVYRYNSGTDALEIVDVES